VAVSLVGIEFNCESGEGGGGGGGSKDISAFGVFGSEDTVATTGVEGLASTLILVLLLAAGTGSSESREESLLLVLGGDFKNLRFLTKVEPPELGKVGKEVVLLTVGVSEASGVSIVAFGDDLQLRLLIIGELTVTLGEEHLEFGLEVDGVEVGDSPSINSSMPLLKPFFRMGPLANNE
jgi:hypothetical protein